MNTIDCSKVRSKSVGFCRVTPRANKWQFKPKSKIARSLAFGEENWKRKEKDVITTKSGQEYRDLQVKSEFDTLVKVWTSAIKYTSLESQQIKHPAFLRIVSMGEKILPLIFAEFSERPFMAWLSALEAIVGKNVASEAKSFREVVELWLKWGKEKRYLKS